MKPFKYVLTVLLTSLVFNFAHSQIAHRGKFYFDDKIAEYNIFSQSEISEIESSLQDLKDANIFVNIMLFSGDCELYPEGEYNWWGPSVDTSCYWADSLTNVFAFWPDWGRYAEGMSTRSEDLLISQPERLHCFVYDCLARLKEVYWTIQMDLPQSLNCPSTNTLSSDTLLIRTKNKHPDNLVGINDNLIAKILTNYCTKVLIDFQWTVTPEVLTSPQDYKDKIYENYQNIIVISLKHSPLLEDNGSLKEIEIIPVYLENQSNPDACFPQFASLSELDIQRLASEANAEVLKKGNEVNIVNNFLDKLDKFLSVWKGPTPFDTECENCNTGPLWKDSTFKKCYQVPEHLKSLFNPDPTNYNSTANINDALGINDEWKNIISTAISRGNSKWNLCSKYFFSFHSSNFTKFGQPEPKTTYEQIFNSYYGITGPTKPGVLTENKGTCNPDIKIWFHYNDDNKEVCINYSFPFLSDSLGTDQAKFIQSQVETIENLFLNEPVLYLSNAETDPEAHAPGETSTWYWGARSGRESEINFFSGFTEVSGIAKTFLATQEFPESLWRPNGDCLFDAPGGLTGISQGAMQFIADKNPIGAYWGIGSMVYSCATDKQTREGIIQLAKNPTIIMEVLWEDIQTVMNPDSIPEVRFYKGSQLLVTVLDLLTGDAEEFVKENDISGLSAVSGSKTKNLDPEKLPSNVTPDFYSRIKDIIPDEVKRKKFLGDFDDVTIKKFVDNPNMLEVWDELEKIGPNRKLRLDIELLEVMASQIDDIDIISSFGGKENYFEFAKKYGGKCGPCDPPSGQAVHLPNAKNFFEDIGSAAKKFGGSPPKVEGFDNFINSFNNNLNVQDGFAHMLNKMKDYDANALKKIDAEFDAPGVTCTNCRLDLEFNIDSKPRFIEYKSFSLNSISGIATKQFKSYLTSITSLDELQYVFNKAKIPESDLPLAKEKFRQLMAQNDPGTFYSSNPSLFEGKRFGGVLIDNENDFVDFINNPASVNSGFFDFIKVK
ncbi:MAG: hypothetical protein R2879_00705 [Saprospiraceae bacterium]